MSYFEILLFAAILFFHSMGNATINRAAQVLSSSPSEIFDSGTIMSPELIQAYLDIKNDLNQKKLYNSSNYIPENLSVAEGGTIAAQRIADKTLQFYIQNSEAKNTKMARSLTAVERLNTNFVLGKSKYREKEHKIDIAVLAFESKAKLTYEGLITAEAFYQAHDATNGIEIREKIGTNKSLILGQKSNPFDRISEVKIHWGW